MRQAEVFSNGVLAGLLTETDDGKYVFTYDDLYFVDKKKSAVGLSFPKNRREFVADELFPFFYNMLSEGSNKDMMGSLFNFGDEDDAFGLLLATAHTDTIGAITVKKI